MYLQKPEIGDVFRFNGNNAYLYFGKREQGHLYILVALSHMPVSESIVKTRLLEAYKGLFSQWGRVYSHPKIFAEKVLHVDLSDCSNLSNIWNLKEA